MMKKTIIIVILLLLISGAFFSYNYVVKRYFPYRNINTELRLANDEPVLSIYQPDSTGLFSHTDSIHHLTLTINGKEKWQVKDWTLLKGLDKETPILLTIELWDRGVLQKMEAGAYDEKLKQLFESHLAEHKKLYLRWNPEMEVPESNLPWGNRGYYYAEAYEKFANLCRITLPTAKMVWGPAGYAGLMENYPGSDYLDMASITMNSDSEKKLEHDPGPLKEQLKRKLHRMRFLQVPVLILGSKNTNIEDFQKNWVAQVSEEIKREKEIINFQNILAAKSDDVIITQNEELQVGVYDPNMLLVNEQVISVEHIFISFKDIQTKSYLQDLNEIFSRNHDAIITVEPKFISDEKDDRAILSSILAGEFDDLITRFYQDLPETDQTIFLRFAHEMEIPVERYPWQSQDPIEYIKAYRYFMQFQEKEKMGNIKKVWGPAGDRGLLEWWPGEDVVDIISIAIYGLPDKNITDPEKQESFSTIYNRKKARINLLNKPLFITEFGVKGDEEFQTNWLVNAAKVIRSEPNIIGINYFNREDVPQAWGDIQPPQWQISNKTFNRFIEELKTKTSSTKEKAPDDSGAVVL